MYIAGSDQIWNPIGKTGLDPAFYLNFGGSGIKEYLMQLVLALVR